MEVEGEILDDGMIMDFSEIKKLKCELDHTYLNELIDQPTAENIALWVCRKVLNVAKSRKVKNVIVRVWESEDSYVEIKVSE